LATKNSEERGPAIASLHRNQLREIAGQWANDLQRLNDAAVGVEPRQVNQQAESSRLPPSVVAATNLARPKAQVELPLLAAMSQQFAALDASTDEVTWKRLAELHADEAALDASSRELIALQTPTAAQAGRLAITKRVVEDPMLRLVRNLQRSIAVDTVRNEYVLHRQLHSWLLEQPALAADVESLNERVYAELFLTPRSDPWLGLAPPDVYTALPNNGVR
jgi:hypothetical protein